ncbi:hypothetical protein EJ02DRAFT_123913 [Clathrospora elynae]|uniref:Uncharacterized protein n=1 Tax=Clathrospora elynae TaxID=706981 RepID=A0A6A5S7N9_9PLEO|nr:hypothetical protein EJ02DRAFT_123913 [Clathrospora elynae]
MSPASRLASRSKSRSSRGPRLPSLQTAMFSFHAQSESETLISCSCQVGPNEVTNLLMDSHDVINPYRYSPVVRRVSSHSAMADCDVGA